MTHPAFAPPHRLPLLPDSRRAALSPPHPPHRPSRTPLATTDPHHPRPSPSTSRSLDLLPPRPIPTPPSIPPPEPPSPPDPAALRLAAAAATLSLFALATVSAHFSSSPRFPAALDMPTAPSAHATLLTLLNNFIIGPYFPVSVGMGLSAFIQSLTGFGFAIVSVGALTQVPWIAHSSVFNTVQPVAATLGAFTGWALILPELNRIDWRAISVLLLASTITTPVGAVILDYFDPNTVIRGLGALISGFVLYSLLGVQVPKKLGSTSGAWGLGFLAGALGGAFDITGPPLVVHGQAADWDTASGDFKRNVLAVVTVNSSLVVLWDFVTGRLNDYYYVDFVKWAFPTTVVGIFLGKLLADRLNPAAFKMVVLGTCMIMGVKLLFT